MESLSWNYLDVLLIIPLGVSLYRGFKSGFIIEFAGLLGLMLGIYGAYKFSDFTTEFLINQFDFQSEYLGIISFLLTFIMILIIVYLIARLITGMVDAIALGVINRIFGVFLAALKMLFILSVIIMMLNSFDSQQKLITQEKKESSLLYTPISKIAPFVFPYLKLSDFSSKPRLDQESNL
jgi:membrane protein required for colicin V production